MNLPLISVIVPVYNTEKYVCECVESLIKQTYPHTEIILVDDGSTDGCPAICDRFAAEHDKVRVIHRENGGLSRARNTGLDAAKGSLISFVDSDDSVHPEMLSRLYALMVKTGASVSGSGLDPARYGPRVDGVLDSTTAIRYMLTDNVNFVTAAWGCIIKAELFDNVRFPEGLIFEDLATWPLLYDKAGVIVHTGDVLYNYRTDNTDSLTRSVFNEKRMDYFVVADKVDAFLAEKYPSLLRLSKSRRTSYAVSFYKQLTESKKKMEPVRKELIRCTRKGLFPFLFGNAKLKVKAYGIVIAVCPPIASVMFRSKPQHNA